MSKQALTGGFFHHGNEGYGLIQGSVDRNPTRVDTSDTNNNNEIMMGRKVWTFTVTVIANNLAPISPDSADEDIAIALGSDIYVGSGRVLSVNHSGSIDDKIVYQVSGEFLPNSYYGNTVSNGLTLFDINGDNMPDGWGDTGGGTRSYPAVDQYGKSWQVLGMATYIASIGKTYVGGAQYIALFIHMSTGVSGFNFDVGSQQWAMSNPGMSTKSYFIQSFTGGVGDNVIRIEGSGVGDMKVFAMETFRIEDSLI